MKIFKFYRLLRAVLEKEWKEQTLYTKLKAQCPDAIFQSNVQFVGDVENLKIGKHSKVNREAYLNVGGKPYGGDGSIEIGENVIIGSKTTLFAGGGSISIGDNCDFGVGVKVLAHTKKDYVNRNIAESRSIFKFFDIQISSECNIGSGAILVGNTKIGAGCQVSPGAVVHGSFANNTLITGNPARAFPILP